MKEKLLSDFCHLPTLPSGQTIHLKEDLKARAKVWSWPESGHTYTIGVDVAEGIIREARNDLAALSVAQLPDFSVAFVIDNKLNKHVATYRSLEDTVTFSRKVYALYAMYDHPLMVVEANGAGIAVLNALEQLGVRNFYQRMAYDKISNIFQKRKGWKTTQNTRELLIKDAIESVTDEDGILPVGKNICSEMKSFVRNRIGRAEAAPGAKDDEVFAMMLAIEGRKQHWRDRVDDKEKYEGHEDGWVWKRIDRQVESQRKIRENLLDEEEILYDDGN